MIQRKYNLFHNKYLVPTTRMSGWDYASPGFYFVTICTLGREFMLGDINDEQMVLSEAGKIADNFWKQIPDHYPFVILDEYQIMPNHIHGIIIINQHDFVETHNYASLQIKNNANEFETNKNKFGPQSQNLPAIIRGFKSSVKRECNKLKMLFYWQPRYYEHMIRSEKEYFAIKNYIRNNVSNWELDTENV